MLVGSTRRAVGDAHLDELGAFSSLFLLILFTSLWTSPRRSPPLFCFSDRAEDSQTVHKRPASLGAETVEAAAPAASAVHDARLPDVGEAESKLAGKGVPVGTRSEGADSPAPSSQPSRGGDGGNGGSEAQAPLAAVAAAV